jgi:hypothetical protein
MATTSTVIARHLFPQSTIFTLPHIESGKRSDQLTPAAAAIAA